MGKIHLGKFLSIVLLIAVLIGGGCASRESNETSLDRINRAIRDSLRTRNIPFIEQAIRQGKSEARDSDEYYNFVVQDMVRYFYTAQPDLMMLSTDSVVRYLSKVPVTDFRNRLMLKCMQAKGLYYTQFVFDADSMLFYQKEACRYAEKDSDIEELLLCYANLADAYKFAGDLSMSAMSYRRAIALADSIHTDRENYVPLYSGLAATYTTLRDFEQSAFWWDKCGELWDLMMLYEQFNYLNSRGNDYYYQEDYQQALKTFLQLDAFLQEHTDMEWERHFCKANLSDIYLKLHEPEKARSLIIENLEYFGKSESNEMVLEHLHTQQMELAMQENNAVEIMYRKYGAEKAGKRHVFPYGIKESAQRWYLVGWVRERGSCRVYALDRIERLSVLPETFSMPAGFDIDALFSTSFGSYLPSGPAQKIFFRAFGNECSYIRDLPLHHTQKIESEDADSMIFSIFVAPDRALLLEFLSHGPGIEVISPENVRQDIMEMTAEMAGIYSGERLRGNL